MRQSVFNYNGRQFVRTAKQVTESTHGFFSSVAGGFKLMDLDRHPMALVCTNESTPFVVTAFKANKQTRYMFSTTQKTERFLGIEGLSLCEERSLSERAVDGYREAQRTVPDTQVANQVIIHEEDGTDETYSLHFTGAAEDYGYDDTSDGLCAVDAHEIAQQIADATGSKLVWEGTRPSWA